jgi:hypothetical protein
MRHHERINSKAGTEKDTLLTQEKVSSRFSRQALAATRRIFQPILESIAQSANKSFSKNDLFALLTKHILNGKSK